MFFISKIQENCFFFLYSQKQNFENRKQKWLPNITLVFSRVYLVEDVEKWEGRKLSYIVEMKSERIENIVYIN